MPRAVPGVWGTAPQGERAQTADAGQEAQPPRQRGVKAGEQAWQQVSGKGRGSDAETGAREAGRDQGEGQAHRYEGDEGPRRREGATQESEGGTMSGREDE